MFKLELAGEVEKGIKPDVIVVDPLRRGCYPELLEAIVEIKPDRLVYISCNPVTLTRYLKVLAGVGYVVREVKPVDMFSWTRHVECVVLIEKE